ncbi:MAG: VWA domain-containing protein [archaeon]|nr:VWA domain-containing protein [archaeon]
MSKKEFKKEELKKEELKKLIDDEYDIKGKDELDTILIEKPKKETKKTNKKVSKTETLDVVYILDRSGSMSNIVSDTINGYNTYLSKQKNNNVKLTTVLFDDKYELLTDRIDISKVNELNSDTYYTRGCTALYDAIGKTISYLDTKKPKKVLFIINTDGLENASIEYDKDKVKNLITKHNDWEFMYIGANIDSYYEASSIGIKASNTANYKKDSKGTKILYEALDCCTEMLCAKNFKKLDASWKENLEDYLEKNKDR